MIANFIFLFYLKEGYRYAENFLIEFYRKVSIVKLDSQNGLKGKLILRNIIEKYRTKQLLMFAFLFLNLLSTSRSLLNYQTELIMS